MLRHLVFEVSGYCDYFRESAAPPYSLDFVKSIKFEIGASAHRYMYEVAEVLEVITKQKIRRAPRAETSMLEETYLLRIRDALGSESCELKRMIIPAAKCRLERERERVYAVGG